MTILSLRGRPVVWLAWLLFILGPQTAALFATNYYSWPVHPSLPGGPGREFFDWTPASPDTFENTALLDLRYLNETVAGQHGWVHAEGDRVLLGDDTPVRFWAVNTTGNASLAVLQQQARFLAKRGVNMVRCHGPNKSLFDNASSNLQDVNMTVVDQLHKVVTAMKPAGIYTFVSNTFFIITMKVKAAWGIEGYDQAWIDAHPDNLTPFGLVFLDPTLRSAYLNWVRVLMTTANPYDENQLSLAEDPAVAIVEILNEENLFFSTFRPANWPEAQQHRLQERFYQWVGAKYLDPQIPNDTEEAAVQRAIATPWRNYTHTDDDLAEGRLFIFPAQEMAVKNSNSNVRFADQLEFLGNIQRDFFGEVTDLLREVGYRGLVSATNWKTASDKYLRDIEYWTYTVTGTVDNHQYFSPVVETTALDYRVQAGDRYYSLPAVVNPRRSPLGFKQVTGYPNFCSETAWVNYNPTAGEGPLLVAAFCGMNDFDCWVWFAQDTHQWAPSLPKWPVGTPVILGQFPGAALLYRRGDAAAAPVVVEENRQLATLFLREEAKVVPNYSYDPIRDKPGNYNPDTGKGKLDPLVMMMGRAELRLTDTDADFIHPRLADLLDNEANRFSSFTGQLTMDFNLGIATVDTPRAQGVTGFLRDNPDLALSSVTFDGDNAFGSILAISLDDRPLAQSERILIQAGATDQMKNFSSEPVAMEYNSKIFAGYKLNNVGSGSWQVEKIAASLRLPGQAARVRQARVLDEDGYPTGTVAGQDDNGDYLLTLPASALYTVIELDPPANLQPVIYSRALPNGRVGEDYAATLDCFPGDPNATWSRAADSAEWPAGLTLSAGGRVTGRPSEGGLFVIGVELTDAGGDTTRQDIDLAVLPLPEPVQTPWGPVGSGWRQTGLGYIFDVSYPFVWLDGAQLWGWCWPTSTKENLYLWLYGATPGWIWTADSLAGWHYSFSETDPGWRQWISPL